MVGAMFSGWALCWWFHCCTVYGPQGKPVGASSSGQGEEAISTLWLLETVQCIFLLVPPLWSAGETKSPSVAAGVCSVGIAGCKQGENAAYIVICPCPCTFVLEPMCPWTIGYSNVLELVYLSRSCCVLELLYIHMSLNYWSWTVYILTWVSFVLTVVLECLIFLHGRHLP